MALFFVVFTGLITLGFTVASAITGANTFFAVSLSSALVFSSMLVIFAFIKKTSSRAFIPSLAASASVFLYAGFMIMSGFRAEIRDFWLIYVLLIVPVITLIAWALSLIVAIIKDSLNKS